MATDPVPWAVSGSQLDTYVMRQVANFAIGPDIEGIQLPGHLKVTQQGTPAGSVTVAAGGVAAKNHAAAGQSYVGRNASATTVAIPANSSGSTRTDLIIATFRDDQYSPWASNPYTLANDILFGPYFYLERIGGVASTTTKASQVVAYSAYALARLSIPTGTTNITDAMITNLRSLAMPRTAFADAQITPGTLQRIISTSTTYANFHSAVSTSVVVPPWATHAVIQANLQPLRMEAAGNAQLRVTVTGTSTVNGTDNPLDYNGGGTAANPEGLPYTVFADVDVTALQGQTVTVRTQARATTGFTATAGFYLGTRERIVFEIKFVERVV